MNGTKRIATLLSVLMALAGASCQHASTSSGATPMPLQLTSPSFREGATIPTKYTCDGQNISPQLDWSGVPAGVKSLALIVDDPDAPIGTFVHWVLYGLAPDLTSLPEGTGSGIQGANGFGKKAYGGPCPPKGKPHRYFFKLYALDVSLDLKSGASKADLERAMRGHILAQGQLIGTYGR